MSTSFSNSGPHATYNSLTYATPPLAVAATKPRHSGPTIPKEPRVILRHVQHDRKRVGEPHWAEANTQAEFYHHARLQELPILLEVTTPAGRIDVAVLCADRSGIVAVVECKRGGRPMDGKSKQIRRYKRLGVPVYGLNDWRRAQSLVSTIKARHGSDAGISWAEIEFIEPINRRNKSVYVRPPQTNEVTSNRRVWSFDPNKTP